MRLQRPVTAPKGPDGCAFYLRTIVQRQREMQDLTSYLVSFRKPLSHNLRGACQPRSLHSITHLQGTMLWEASSAKDGASSRRNGPMKKSKPAEARMFSIQRPLSFERPLILRRCYELQILKTDNAPPSISQTYFAYLSHHLWPAVRHAVFVCGGHRLGCGIAPCNSTAPVTLSSRRPRVKPRTSIVVHPPHGFHIFAAFFRTCGRRFCRCFSRSNSTQRRKISSMALRSLCGVSCVRGPGYILLGAS